MAETALDRLRCLLPEAKRICSREYRSAAWDALLAAEALLCEIDARRAAERAEMTKIEAVFAEIFPGGMPMLMAALEEGERQRVKFERDQSELVAKFEELRDTAPPGEEMGPAPALEAGP